MNEHTCDHIHLCVYLLKASLLLLAVGSTTVGIPALFITVSLLPKKVASTQQVLINYWLNEIGARSSLMEKRL